MLDAGELADEGAQAGDVVGGDEQVNVRQGGLHSPGGGFVAGIAHQRVEPEDAAGVLLEEVHALIERLDVARVPAVADDQHHRAVIHQRESVVLHEALQGLANLGAPGPVRDRGGELVERVFQLLGFQGFGDAVQGGAEDKGFDAAVDALEGIDELDEETAVEVHGLADIAEQHELEPLPLALTVREVEDFPAPAQGPPHGAPQIQRPAPPGAQGAAAEAHRERPADFVNEPCNLVQVLLPEAAEVALGQHLIRAVARRVLLIGGVRVGILQPVADAHEPLLLQAVVNDHRLLLCLLLPTIAQRLRVVPDVPVVPEVFVKDFLLALALGKGGPQRPEKGVLVREVNAFQSAQGVHLLHRTDPGAVPAQVAAEPHHVRAEFTTQGQVVKQPLRIRPGRGFVG